MSDKIRWEEMFPDEFVQRRDACPVAYMAYGLAEPHGAYNALGLDWLKAQALVERAAQEHGGIVAPPCAWHIQDVPEFHDNGKGVGWLCSVGVTNSLASSVPGDLFYRMVFHQIRAFDARGFHGVILVTGHYGGVERVLRLACEYYLRRTGSPIRLRALADCECIDEILPFRGDHAGICETSQLLHLHPGFVDLNRARVPAGIGEAFAGHDFAREGRSPSEEIGRQIVQSQVRNLGKISRELLESYRPRQDWKTPNQHEVDDLWHRFERITRNYWTLTYSEFAKGKKYCMDFPGWEAFGE